MAKKQPQAPIEHKPGPIAQAGMEWEAAQAAGKAEQEKLQQLERTSQKEAVMGWGETKPTGKAEPQQQEWAVDEKGEPTPLGPAEQAVEQLDADNAWNAPAPQVFSELTIATHGGTFDPNIAKIMIYGESGTGKTRFASTFPAPIFADIDLGMSSVTEVVDRMEITDFKQLISMYEFLKAGDHTYQTVVIDTLNEMQRLAMHATITDFATIRRSYGDLPSMSDYGKMLHDFEELVRDFILLPMRVVLLAQVNSRQFDTDVLMPQLVGKNSARIVARKMDVIGYIYKSDKEDSHTNKKISEISFDATEFVTKDRSFKLPAMLTAPTYERMAEFWK
jgi:hypothetical protein